MASVLLGEQLPLCLSSFLAEVGVRDFVFPPESQPVKKNRCMRTSEKPFFQSSTFEKSALDDVQVVELPR